MDAGAYAQMAEEEATHWWYVARRSIVGSVLDGLGLPPGARILEVGCGSGGNLGMLSARGRVSAMELDDNARAVALAAPASAGADIRPGHMPDGNPFAGERFDLIVMMDVLEHIEDDNGTLEHLRGCLAEGGRLLITVPAYQWMFGRHDELLHHKRRYTRAGLTEKLRRAGFRVRRATYFNTFLFPVAAAARLMEKVTRPDKVAGQAQPAPAVNGTLRAIFGAERGVLRATNLPFGVSILALAEAAGPAAK